MDYMLGAGGMQTVLASFGLANMNGLLAPTGNLTDAFSNSTFLGSSPVQGLRSLVSNGDYSTLLTRFVQFGALGSVLQFLGISEAIRWAYYSLYNYVIGRFVLNVYLDGDDMPYLWMLVWLSKQEAWTSNREVQVTSQNYGLGATLGTLGQRLPPRRARPTGAPPDRPRPKLKHAAPRTIVPGEDTKGKEGQRLLTTLPWNESPTTLWFKGRLMRVTRTRPQEQIGRPGPGSSSLAITIYTRKHQVLYDLLLEAKQMYEAELETRVIVYNLDQWNNWLYCGARPKRSMNSVIIDSETKDLLLEDCKDFLDSEEWYGQRGIPWQRGWLLYGAPGSGKTSTIQALAGELGLHIYVVSLSKRGMDDTSLNTLINAIPPRTMILMEDIDAAFTRSVTREPPPVSSNMGPNMGMGMGMGGPGMGMGGGQADNSPSSVTLSGLLNAIDGVQAQQGRLLFATTNKYDALDPALVRPGRLDLHVEFTLATKWQAAELFRRFYPVVENEKAERNSSADDASDEKCLLGDDAAITEEAEAEEDLGAVQRVLATGLTQGQRSRKAPSLTTTELEALATRFSDAIPEHELSMASIQGHLMMHKTRPHEAVRSVRLFVTKERERLVKARQLSKEEAAAREKASDAAAAAAASSSTSTSRRISASMNTPPMPDVPEVNSLSQSASSSVKADDE